jgi:hypothetical protein
VERLLVRERFESRPENLSPSLEESLRVDVRNRRMPSAPAELAHPRSNRFIAERMETP